MISIRASFSRVAIRWLCLIWFGSPMRVRQCVTACVQSASRPPIHPSPALRLTDGGGSGEVAGCSGSMG